MAKKAAAKPETQKNLKETIAQIEKAFGAGSIMRLGDNASMVVEGVSTGSLSIDHILGGFGLPKGRVVEFFGQESSGKTTMALTAVANAQKLGGVAAYIDVEHALDPAWCKKLGVDIESLLVAQPGSAEECLQTAEMLVKSNQVQIVVIDSVAAMVPKVEIEGEIGDATVGVMARLMSQALRKLVGAVHDANCILIFINQIRDKIGSFGFGPQTTTPGGRALKFYSSIRMEVARIGPVKSGETVVGSRVKVKIVKNKIAPPFRVAEVDLMYDSGVSLEGDLIDMGLAHKVIDKSGAWLNFGDERLACGREATRLLLKSNAEIRDRLTAAVQKKMTAMHSVPAPPPENEEEDVPDENGEILDA